MSESEFPESSPSKQTHPPERESAGRPLKSVPSAGVLCVQPPQHDSQSPPGAARQAAAAGPPTSVFGVTVGSAVGLPVGSLVGVAVGIGVGPGVGSGSPHHR